MRGMNVLRNVGMGIRSEITNVLPLCPQIHGYYEPSAAADGSPYDAVHRAGHLDRWVVPVLPQPALLHHVRANLHGGRVPGRLLRRVAGRTHQLVHAGIRVNISHLLLLLYPRTSTRQPYYLRYCFLSYAADIYISFTSNLICMIKHSVEFQIDTFNSIHSHGI